MSETNNNQVTGLDESPEVWLRFFEGAPALHAKPLTEEDALNILYDEEMEARRVAVQD